MDEKKVIEAALVDVIIDAFAKWREISDLMPDTIDPEVQAAFMQACWLVRGPAGVSKSDIFPKNAIVETITIPVPEEWEKIQEEIENAESKKM